MVIAESKAQATGTENNKPNHRVSHSEKYKDKKAYFRESADYYLAHSRFGFKSKDSDVRIEKMQTLYNLYNNTLPTEWFSHVTNPLGSDRKEHKQWAGKIRPVTILRPNIDLLRGEMPKRPFNYQVVVEGEPASNRYTEELNKRLEGNIQQHFVNALHEMADQGQADRPDQEAKPIELPSKVQELFGLSYRDKVALMGQRKLKRTLMEVEFENNRNRLFLDWCIAGEVVTYKTVSNGKPFYERINPMYFDGAASTNSENGEDGEWAAAMYEMTLSDIVDLFYDELTEEDWSYLEAPGMNRTPQFLFSTLTAQFTNELKRNILPVYHVTWKGKKEVIFINYTDPLTGEQQIKEVSEEYKPEPGEVIRREWRNEVYQAWKVGTKGYFRMGPTEVQRTSLSNSSECKLPYNRRRYSDVNGNNISIMEIGVPMQILYIILHFKIERYVVESKGKMVFMDKNAIPRDKGWDEEKFFYYSSSLGWALIDRNQVGVDKSYNQYQVVDMSMYDSIKQLIDLMNAIKSEWDDILGITRQRKGQSMATDTVGATERAVFQSNVITDMVFYGFEQFIGKEITGFLDMTKLLDHSGLRAMYNDDAVMNEIIEVDPVAYQHEDLGIFITDSSNEQVKLNKMKSYVDQFVNSKAKPTTVLEIIAAESIVALKAKLQEAERIEQQIAEQQQKLEQQGQLDLVDKQKDIMEFEASLKEQLMNLEYDRKEEIELIKGDIAIETWQGGSDLNNDGIPDIDAIADRSNQRELHMATLGQKERDSQRKHADNQVKNALTAKQIASNEKIAKEKAVTDRIKARRPTSK